MLISAYLKAFRILKDKEIKEFAIKSLGKIIKIHFINNDLFHSGGVKALLDDYIYLIEAIIAAYEVTEDTSHLSKSDKLMGICIERFWDRDDGGFFDTDDAVLGLRLKGIEDIPHPSANSLGIILLLKLYHLTNKGFYLQYAEKALRAFSLRAKDMGMHSACYYAALDAYFHMLRLTLYTSPDSELTVAALSSFSPYTSIAYGEDRG